MADSDPQGPEKLGGFARIGLIDIANGLANHTDSAP